jgi:phage baseplate assembly protein gpV
MGDEADDHVIPTQEVSAGAAQRPDAAATRRRAEASDLLPPEELDEKQRNLRERRRWGGPDLDEESRVLGDEQEEVPGVAPTETEDPPASPSGRVVESSVQPAPAEETEP